MLRCTKCNTDKPDDEFYRSKSAPSSRRGRTHWCKGCYGLNYENNRERQLTSNYRANIKRRYGLTVTEYEALIASGCSVCGSSAEGRIVLDHCHATNSVRAPLCDGCNRTLGAVQDDAERLRKLADYLDRHASS